MTSDDLLDFQEIMLRAHLRNLIFFATLPYHLTQQTRCNHGWDTDGERTSGPSSVVFLEKYATTAVETEHELLVIGKQLLLEP
jgi:hypothetical protein